MSSGRMKDQKDFDLEQIVKVIDQALESDDQRIKDALRALMTITVLCTAQHPDQLIAHGPLSRLFDDMRNINRRVSQLEDELNQMKWDKQRAKTEPFMPSIPAGQPLGPYANPLTSPWTGTNPNGPKPMWGPSWTSAGDDPNYKGASATSANDFTEWNDIASTLPGTHKLAEDFLKELESK